MPGPENRMEDLICEGYDLEFVPVKASIESKTGITFKGKDGDYLSAQRMLKVMMQKKGERFTINGIDLAILDAPKLDLSILK